MPLSLAQTLTLAQIPGWAISLLAIGFLIVCLSLVLIVLIQRPQGGGLSGAFGAGGGAGQTAFGTKTGDVLTLVTIGIFVLFLLTAIGLNFAVRPPKAPTPANAIVNPEAAEEESVGEAVIDEMTDDEGAALDQTGDDEPAPATPEPPVDAPVEDPATDPAADPATDPATGPGDGTP